MAASRSSGDFEVETLAPMADPPWSFTMIFKNLSIYKTGSGISQQALDDFLGKHKFEPCLPSQESSAGFTTLFGLDTRVFSVNGCHLFCLKVDEKVIPPSAVKAEFKLRKEKRERALGRKLTPAEREEVRLESRSALCEVAFCRPADLWAYLDAKAGFLVVNTTSAKSASGLSQIVAGSMPGKEMLPFLPSGEIQSVMTKWLKDGVAELPFVLGDKCEITDGEGVIRYRDRLLSDTKLQNYLEDGLLSETLSLMIPGRYSFVLTTDFVVKEFSVDAEVVKNLRVPGADALEIVSTELREMSDQIRHLLHVCQIAFGAVASK